MAIGITPSQTAYMPGRGQFSDGVLCVAGIQTAVGTATYNFWPTVGAPYGLRIVRCHGHCTAGAPGAGDTVVIQHVNAAGTATAITDTADLQAAGLGDTDTFDFAQLDDAQWFIPKGDQLRVVTASDTTAMIYVEYIKNSEAS